MRVNRWTIILFMRNILFVKCSPYLLVFFQVALAVERTYVSWNTVENYDERKQRRYYFHTPSSLLAFSSVYCVPENSIRTAKGRKSFTVLPQTFVVVSLV